MFSSVVSPRYCFVFLLLIVLLPLRMQAQTNVWETASKKSAKTKEKVGKQTSKVKKWKDHIQQWGLDTNYNRGLLVGAKLSTNGWSGSIYYYKKIAIGKDRIWQLSFSEIKDDKELKQQRTSTTFTNLGAPSPFIFGKINQLYALQLGYGREQLLLPGVLEGNISLSFRYQAGISVAMLKPYYLRLVYVDYTTPDDKATLKEERYSTSNSAHFLDNGYILGASKWNKGLDEMTYVPGLFAEGAFVIAPAKNKTFVQLITLGANAAFYSKSLPIMADRKAYPWQASLFAGLAIGKRWK